MKLVVVFAMILVVSCGEKHKDPLPNNKTADLKDITSTQNDPHCQETEGIIEEEPLPRSCLDLKVKGANKCGHYKIYDSSGNGFTVYCDMETEAGSAWTLVTSWALKYNYLLRSSAFKTNAPLNENSPNWFMYRLTADRMKSIREVSTHWRATCRFEDLGINAYTDYMRGSFSSADVYNYLTTGNCLKVEYINVRGYIGVHQTARFYQKLSSYAGHIDSSTTGCQYYATTGAVKGEDNFGNYAVVNPQFTCTADETSTTQWWFGGYT